MRINYTLALNIRKKIESNGKSLNDLNVFTESELKKITNLEIINADNLEDIDKLPNLKRLVIKSEDYNNFAGYMDLENNPLINRIKNFSNLEKLTNLEELEIINDINIKKINFSKLPNLKKLHLINNPNLIAIKHLEKLKNLESVIIYGTNVKSSINIDEYIINTFNAKTNILDINMYSNIVKGLPKNSNIISNLYRLGFVNIKFAEKTGFAGFALLTPDKVNELFQKCYTVINNKKMHRLNDYDKIKEVYNYVTTNITFDSQGVFKRDKQFLEMNYRQSEIPLHLKNTFSMLHSSYNAGILRKSNCEGYVNLMNFMLKMLNIDAVSVYSTDKSNRNIASYNHALTSVKLNGVWYYCEPTWERPGELKYFMKSYDEIIKTHVLNPFEQQKNKEVNFNVNYNARNHKCR